MHSSILAVTTFCVCFAVSVLCAVTLAERNDRKAVVLFAVAGVFIACVKIWLFRQAPQWLDTPLDAQKYQLHAEALAAHWQGVPVSSRLYQLVGLSALRSEDWWLPGVDIAYSSVLGTHEWIYAAYLAVWASVAPDWPTWAAYSNGALAALFPAGAYGIARGLGSSAKVATLAGGIALVDPSAAVNGAWLLKDTLASWCVVVALWATVGLISRPRISLFFVLGASLGMLGAVRFMAMMVVLIALVPLLPVFVAQRRIALSGGLLVASLCGLFLFHLLNAFPGVESNWLRPFGLVSSILAGQADTLTASAGGGGGPVAVDSTVRDWYELVSQSPLRAIATGVARTLFAPYPWVMITDGLDFQNGVELYYPGVLLWIICLPGIFWAIWLHLRNPRLPAIFLGLVIGGCLTAYLVFMGEWSTRQRVFMLPVFFSLAAIGWVDLTQRVRSRTLHSASTFRSTDSEL